MIKNEGSLKCFKFYFEKKKKGDPKKNVASLETVSKNNPLTKRSLCPCIITALEPTLFARQSNNLLPRLQRTLESVSFITLKVVELQMMSK